MGNVLSQRRHERHPGGLLIVIGLHVLLAVMMLTAKLRIDMFSASPSALASVDSPPPPPEQSSHALPSAPAAPMYRIVVPVPEVVVDRPDPIQATTQEAPPPPVPSQVPSTAPSVAPVATVSRNDGAGTSAGAGDGSGGTRLEPRPARVYVDARCEPDYPVAARLHNVAGTTRLRFTLDAAGQILGVRLLGRSGEMPENDVLDKAAMESLVHCPTAVGIDQSGHPVGGTADVNYNWRIF